jgi:hypothetical protein
MSIVRIGLSEAKHFARGYDAIFAAKKSSPKKAAPKKKTKKKAAPKKR